MAKPNHIQLAITSITDPEQTGEIKLRMADKKWEETEPADASDIMTLKSGHLVTIGRNLIELRVQGPSNSVADIRGLQFASAKVGDRGNGYPSDPNPPNAFKWECTRLD
jgi:hypothetical protein